MNNLVHLTGPDCGFVACQWYICTLLDMLSPAPDDTPLTCLLCLSLESKANSKTGWVMGKPYWSYRGR